MSSVRRGRGPMSPLVLRPERSLVRFFTVSPRRILALLLNSEVLLWEWRTVVNQFFLHRGDYFRGTTVWVPKYDIIWPKVWSGMFFHGLGEILWFKFSLILDNSALPTLWQQFFWGGNISTWQCLRAQIQITGNVFPPSFVVEELEQKPASLKPYRSRARWCSGGWVGANPCCQVSTTETRRAAD